MGIMSFSQKEIANALEGGKITICIVGLGRIGLPQAVSFAKAGAYVIGADIDPAVVESVNSGKNHLSDEQGLDELMQEVTAHRKLNATTNVSAAVEVADAVIVCVPTPVDKKRLPDYSEIVKACHDIAQTLQKDSLVVIESTIGPGIVEDIIIPQLENETKMKVGVDFGVASCPERANPGRILEDLRSVPRIVGGIDDRSAKVTATLYKKAFGARMIIVSDPKTANATKMTENLFRDVNIALANEFALLYEKLGIDVIEVINACATKYNFMPHYPGAGVGGPCLPQNPYFLIHEGTKVGYSPSLIKRARQINDEMPRVIALKVMTAMKRLRKEVEGSEIAILGVAYKPNLHDLQLTPVEKIFYHLKNNGAYLNIYDPMFEEEVIFGQGVSESLEEAVKGVDCILVGTAHDEFRTLDFSFLKHICNMPVVFADIANTTDPSTAEKHGFVYIGIGRNGATNTCMV